MEDSMEDFIRFIRNGQRKSNDPSAKIRQELLVTAQKKKECEANALKIVEFLIQGKLKPGVFLRCLKHINPQYYQDAVEERAITKLCGYSLCSNKIPEMPQQKYIITKSNKVYEITEQKNFCSNFCYKASVHVKNQLDTSPLWLRNPQETPTIQLLPSNESGLPGEFIDQGVVKVTKEEISFTSIAEFTQASLEEVSLTERKTTKINKRKSSLNVIDEEENYESDNCDNESIKSEKYFSDDDENQIKLNNGDEERLNEIVSRLKDVKLKEEVSVRREIICKSDKQKLKTMNEKEKLEFLKKKLKIDKNPKAKLTEALPLPTKMNKTKLESIKEIEVTAQETDTIDPSLARIKDCILSWLTIETYIFIHGEKKVKELINEKKLSDCFDKLQITDLHVKQQLKYLDICRKVQLQEWAEEKFHKSAVGDVCLKPLPDYQRLKEKHKELELKVKSFYGGTMCEQSKNIPSKENENDSVAVLPLVDAYTKNALRRRIFFNSINKMLKTHIKEFHLGGTNILSDVHDLVKTFKLEADNIVFKPVQWTVISLVLLEMLSIKDVDLKRHCESPRWKEYIKLLSNTVKGSEQFFNEIYFILDDADLFIETYVKGGENVVNKQ